MQNLTEYYVKVNIWSSKIIKKSKGPITCSVCLKLILSKSGESQLKLKISTKDDSVNEIPDYLVDEKIKCTDCGLYVHKQWGVKYFTSISNLTKKWTCDLWSYLQTTSKSNSKFASHSKK